MKINKGYSKSIIGNAIKRMLEKKVNHEITGELVKPIFIRLIYWKLLDEERSIAGIIEMDAEYNSIFTKKGVLKQYLVHSHNRQCGYDEITVESVHYNI